ncbi:MAG: ABC transporter permease [Anaerolineae bacterium]|nr:ABC transporter permease [Anaerolineae bacterium]
MDLQSVASPTGLIIGALCGLVPLAVAIRQRTLRPGILGFVACLFSGFACNVLGGLPMIVLTVAVVVSYTYTDKDDPFLSRARLEDVDFEETFGAMVTRRLASLGRTVRGGSRALVRNKAGFLGFLGLVFFFVLTIFGPMLIPYDGKSHYYDRRREGAISLFQGPSAEFPLGLDWQGRDILSHIVHGGRSLILTAVQAGVLTTIIAVTLGALSALLGGFLDRALTMIANFILTIPQFPLLVVLAGLISFQDRFYLALLLAVLDWPSLMRAVRAQVLSLRERDYVEAAVVLDLGLPHIMLREVLPQMISYVSINMIFSIQGAMYAIVGLVFLGMVPFTEPDWGVMIFMGRSQGALFSTEAASMLLSPVIAVALFQLSLVLFTRSLEEVFNPRLRAGL